MKIAYDVRTLDRPNDKYRLIVRCFPSFERGWKCGEKATVDTGIEAALAECKGRVSGPSAAAATGHSTFHSGIEDPSAQIDKRRFL